MNCPELRTATLVGCKNVGSRAIQLLARRCPHLEELRAAMAITEDDQPASKQQCLSDLALETVVAGCHGLSSVSFTSLRSDRILADLLDQCQVHHCVTIECASLHSLYSTRCLITLPYLLAVPLLLTIPVSVTVLPHSLCLSMCTTLSPFLAITHSAAMTSCKSFLV